MALRRVPRVARLVAGVAAVGLTADVRAEEPRTASLGWSRLPGAEACPGGRDLARDVEARLGHAVFVSPSTSDLEIEGRVEVAPAPAAFRATLRLIDRQGTTLGSRELETADPTCRELGDLLGLAIALLIDPDAVEAPPVRPEARPEAPAAWIGAPRLDEPGGEEPTRPAPEPWRFQTDAGVASAAGLFPRVAVGGRLRLLLDPEGFPGLEIGATHFPEVQGNTSYSLTHGSFGVCPWTPDFSVIAVATCAGAHVGAFTAAASRTDVIVLPYAKAGVVRRVVGPIAATVDVGLAIPTYRHIYDFGEAEPFQMSPVAGTLDLGLGIEVP